MAVKVRYREVNNSRYNIYLDSYKQGIRKTETLNGYVVTRDYSGQKRKSFANKQDEEFVIKAEAKAAQENTKLLTDTPPLHRNVELFHYLDKKIAQCTNSRSLGYQRLKANLKKYQPTPILIRNITTLWLRDFKSFLEGVHKPNTTDTYLNYMKILLQEAIEENYIHKSPFPKKNFFINADIDCKIRTN